MKQQTIIFLIGFILFLNHVAYSQQHSYTIEQCIEMAKQNYPLIKQQEIIKKTKEYSIANAQKGLLPQINISSQESYQSDVTKIPIELPNLTIPTIGKEQYRIYGEVSESITDWLNLSKQKKYINIGAKIETQKIEIELYTLQERVYQLYFGILIIDAQIQLNELLKKDIQHGIDNVHVAISNGISTNSTADNMKAELLKAEQREIEMKATRKGYADMLGIFINDKVDENTVLVSPASFIPKGLISRPELKLFDLQVESLDLQKKLMNTRHIPHLSVFFQTGWGKPGMNMLNSEPQMYYIGGIRMKWDITHFYTHKNDMNKIALQKQTSDIQRKTFLLNTQLLLKQYDAERAKLKELIQTDKNIILLRENVKKTIQSQLKYGIVTSNDYLTAVNAQDQAQQNMILHEIQLLMVGYKLKIIEGN